MILSASSNNNVDFPIPGSPDNKTAIPGTIPPPKTISSSEIPVDILFVWVVFMSDNLTGCIVETPDRASLRVFCVICSTNEFHVPHSGHFPKKEGL